MVIFEGLSSCLLQPGTHDSDGKESTCNAGDIRDSDSIPELERSPGGGNRNPLQYSCLRNHMARGAWQAIVHGAAKELDTT